MVVKTGTMACAVAEYIAELTAELARLAASSRHDDLVQILEMARLESERLCGRNQDKVPEPPADNIILFHTRLQ